MSRAPTRRRTGERQSLRYKVSGGRDQIEAADAELLYLPPYSPDFNPIEQCWGQLKQYLRAATPERSLASNKNSTTRSAKSPRSSSKLTFATVDTYYEYSETALVKCGLVVAGVSNICMMVPVLGKTPWNRVPGNRVAGNPVPANCERD